MFECKGCTAQRSEVAHLRSLVADQQDMLRQQETRHVQERERLTSQLLAATKPYALTALATAEQGRSEPKPVRPNFPGLFPTSRGPAKPPEWLTRPPAKGQVATPPAVPDEIHLVEGS